MENLTTSLDLLSTNNTGIKIKFDIKSNQINNHRFKYSNFIFEEIENIAVLKDFFKDEAIRNLIKKNNFLQLFIQFTQEQISEDEYENELTSNPDMYFIEMKELKSDIDFIALQSALRSLPKGLSIDDVSEIFGIQQELLLNKMLN